ncbi:MAG TPA: GNAT family N-acetyltransferase [Gemmatimonadales bacterium]|jgi:RimJ/RimL family protein N-acetyltransferase
MLDQRTGQGKLETQRLVLRELDIGDLDFVASMLEDPRVTRFYPKRYTRADAAGWIERQRTRYAEDGYGLWLVLLRGGGTPVGQVGLLRQEVNGILMPEIGYLLAQRFWGQGIATEAAIATRDYAFGELGFDRVVSLIRPENLPSQGVARRVGMRPVGSTLHAGLEHLVFAIDR